ncbi:MAG: hypothetical protein J0H44_21005 [Alphaproteobacteria bacterium]|nr:hypothetical protein [Alphaproteobacteria bacterium]
MIRRTFLRLLSAASLTTLATALAGPQKATAQSKRSVLRVAMTACPHQVARF